ncbi:MAG: F0F1 ATP synthase subunit epsilon [Muribaculaceae bacterium]|nr:F0F1 ATP synthase subunit epsilon [Muribaculaceae bacterium]
MTLKVISAEAVLFEGEVTSVTLPGEMGAFTVLRNHASLISTLVPGQIAYRGKDVADSAEPAIIEVSGGIAVVDDNVVSVCVI